MAEDSKIQWTDNTQNFWTGLVEAVDKALVSIREKHAAYEERRLRATLRWSI